MHGENIGIRDTLARNMYVCTLDLFGSYVSRMYKQNGKKERKKKCKISPCIRMYILYNTGLLISVTKGVRPVFYTYKNPSQRKRLYKPDRGQYNNTIRPKEKKKSAKEEHMNTKKNPPEHVTKLHMMIVHRQRGRRISASAVPNKWFKGKFFMVNTVQ